MQISIGQLLVIVIIVVSTVEALISWFRFDRGSKSRFDD